MPSGGLLCCGGLSGSLLTPPCTIPSATLPRTLTHGSEGPHAWDLLETGSPRRTCPFAPHLSKVRNKNDLCGSVSSLSVPLPQPLTLSLSLYFCSSCLVVFISFPPPMARTHRVHGCNVLLTPSRKSAPWLQMSPAVADIKSGDEQIVDALSPAHCGRKGPSWYRFRRKTVKSAPHAATEVTQGARKLDGSRGWTGRQKRPN